MSNHTPHRGKASNAYPIGSRFNRWTLVAHDGGKSWLCRCDCGTEKVVDAYTVRNGQSQSCGCLAAERASERSANDYSGQRFGRLVAIEPVSRRAADGSVFWRCQCDCGNETQASTTNLRSGSVHSCGCLHERLLRLQLGIPSHGINDLTGRRFERLVVLGPEKRNNVLLWRCRCDCGNETLAYSASLRKGLTRSCGCLNRELTRERSTGVRHWNWKGGVVPWNQRDRNAPEYKAWKAAVIERDGGICAACGEVAPIAVAHHVESWATNLELRLDVDNGVTMCKGCHWDFHRQYGKGDNTRHQLVEYVGRRRRGAA